MCMNAKRIRGYLILAIAGLAVYFINVEVQTYFGERALRETGLEIASLEDAQATARETGRPILADLSAIWCPTCRKLDQTVFTDAGVHEELEQNFVFARIEYESDDGEKFMQRYNVRGFPNLLVLNADGKLIRQLPIVFDPNEFRRNLVAAREAHASQATGAPIPTN